MKFPTLMAAAMLLVLTACSPPQPVRLGFLGGLSGRVADLGEAGRNGALMAVEEANAAGGINGHRIELLIHDDAQKAETAVKETESLVAEGVVAIIGPMTSSMAEAVLPVATRAGLVMVSPTVTASNLRGKDDLLFKVAPSVEEHTRRMADFLFARGLKRGAIAFDLSNKAYTADWTEHFRRDFTAHGGAIAAEASFTSGDDAAYGDVIKTLAASKPDFLLFITSAVDAVRLAQLARNLGLTQPVASSTWAATEALLQLGGRTIEGVVLTQFFNRDDRSPRYLLFAEAFRARFKQDPGFASVAAYDATSAVLKALEKSQGTALKDALLASGPYQGLQESWNFDRNGDAVRQTRIAMVRSGRFVIVD